MNEYIVSRYTNDELEHLIEMFNWCEENFGKISYDTKGWECGFADLTDYNAKFTFFDKEMATLFLLRWGNEQRN